ncbi:alkaline phosphatase family protein [Bacteroidia bacterium]|nr:alkaline phosphatase family protein [Bacteroidia bacterium]
MRSEMVSDPQMPAPTIKQIAQDGIYVKKVNCVAPSSTYPSHTSIITGALPVRHGIYYNTRFNGNGNYNPTNWYADSIRTQTIWGAAKKRGLTTASLLWPVSTHSKDIDINIPEYWSLEQGIDHVQYLRDHSTPAGIFDELEEQATGKLTSQNFNPYTRNREGRTGYMATYIMGKYRPNLMTIHFISTDYYQHKAGIHSNEVKMALSAVDYGINQVIEGLHRHQIADSTVVIVCGDHGFTDVSRLIAPNVWLAEAGLLTSDSLNWKAKFHGSGATMFLYLKEKNDKKTLRAVREKLQSLPDATRSLFRIVEQDELTRLGCSPDVSLAVEPILGVGVATNLTGADVVEQQSGKHGYLSPFDPTTLVAFGPGIPKKIINEINITDIAAFVTTLLGIPFDSPDGRLVEDMVRESACY